MRIRSIILLLNFIVVIPVHGQDTVDVVEKNIKVGGMSRETEYYGFAAGDKVIFSLSVENGKELKDVTIAEYPDNIKFADHSTGKISGKMLNILRNGVYSFEYYNSNLSGRVVNIKIQRIPRADATAFFNTNIKWITKVDTTYVARERQVLTGSDTAFETVLDSKVRVHSQTNLDNPNKTLVDFILPANTVRWSYWIGVGEEGDKAYRESETRFLNNTSKLLSVYSPLVGVALNLFSMSGSSLGDNVKFYFLPTASDSQKLMNGLQFMQFKNGDVVTESGFFNFGTANNQRYYLALLNDNLRKGIDVAVKVLAVVVKEQYVTVVEKSPVYSNRTVPVHQE